MKLIYVPISLCLMASCSNTAQPLSPVKSNKEIKAKPLRENFSLIQVGMAKLQVEQIMGKPERISKTVFGDLLYTYPHNSANKELLESKRKFWIVFNRGLKVKEKWNKSVCYLESFPATPTSKE